MYKTKLRQRFATGCAALLAAASALTAQADILPGRLKFEYFGGIGGTPVANLTSAAKYTANQPDQVLFLTAFDSRTVFADDSHDNYGARITGYIVPDTTGDYHFFLRSDDASELWISTDATTANLKKVAEETGCCAAFQEVGNARTTATPIHMVAGQRYAVRALVKEGGGGDYVQVAMRMVGDETPAASLTPIPETYLAAELPPITASAVASPEKNLVTVTFNNPVDETTAGNPANYSIAGLAITEVKVLPSGVGVQLTTAPQTPGTQYNLRISNVTDISGGTIAANTSVPFSGFVLSKGFLNFEYYGGLTGASQGDLDSFLADRALGAADRVIAMPGPFSTLISLDPTGNFADNYGARISGLITPTVSGDYRFFIRSDDASYLQLSTDATAANAVTIASEPNCCGGFMDVEDAEGVRNGETSEPISLVAGQSYYIAMVFKEGGGGDWAEVAWRREGDTTAPSNLRPIPANVLSAYVQSAGAPVVITTQPANVTAAETATATFNVAATIPTGARVWYQWQKNGVDIVGANSASYTTPLLVPADNNAVYTVKIGIPGSDVVSQGATLTVTADLVKPTVLSARATPGMNQVNIQFSEPVNKVTAETVANYAIAGLTVQSATQTAPDRVTLNTTAQNPGATYNLVINGVKDASVAGNQIENNTTSSFRAFIVTPGFVKFEWYDNIGGTAVSALTNSTAYQNNQPSGTAYLTALDSRQRFADDAKENYGGRFTGFIVPTTTGDYRFFLNSDDASELRLSTDATPANLAKIAEETGCCNAFAEPGTPRTSEPITLQAGQRYYVEYLYKEGGGGDYGRIAWREEQDTTPAGSLTPIQAQNLATLVDPTGTTLNITGQPANLTVGASTGARFTVGVNASSPLGTNVTVQWQKAAAGSSTFVNIPGATSAGLYIPFATPADNNTQYRAIVSIGNLLSVTSNPATLTVLNESIAPVITSANGTIDQVVVTFSEPIQASSLVAANFSIAGGATITGVTAGTTTAGAGQATLALSGATAGQTYEITVNNVRDASGNTIAANSKVSFIAYSVLESFESSTIANGVVLGNAVIQTSGGVGNSGVVRLTDAAGSQQGSIVFNDILSGGEMTSMTAIFRLRIGEPSGNAADGFSFNVANDPNTASSFGEEGTGNGLTISIDTYDNGTGEQALPEGGVAIAPAIDVKWAGQTVANVPVPKSTLVNNQYVTVAIRLTSDGKVSVQHNGVTYHNNVQLPDYLPITAPSVAIGARTGGEWASHRVDDLSIVFNQDVPLPQGPEVRFVSADPSPNLKGVTLYFSGDVDATSAAVAANYTSNGGLTVTSAKVLTPRSVFLTTSQQTEGASYTITVGTGLKDTVGRSLATASRVMTFNALHNLNKFINWEAYRDIGGGSVNDLINHPKFPVFPDDTRLVREFEGPTGYGDNYGSRLRGFVIPPTTGNYRFYISSDDNSQLWLSTDDSPANAVMIANEPVWNGVRDWNGTGADALTRRPEVDDGSGGLRRPNISNPVALEAGKRYYIEMRHKEGGGGDNAAATFALDGTTPANNSMALTGDAIATAVRAVTLDPATAVALGSGGTRGFSARVHQLNQAGTVSAPTTVDRAEQQLAGLLGDNVANLTGAVNGRFNIDTVINWNQDAATGNAGGFTNDVAIPGIPGTGNATYGTDSIAAEINTYVEFPTAGLYILGVNGDDGFRMTSATAAPANNGALVVAGGSAAGTYAAISGGAGNAGGTFGRLTAPLSGKLVMVESPDALPTEGCLPFVNAPIVRGNIAVVFRGTCTFDVKVANAVEAGAIGVVIINNRPVGHADGTFPIVATGGLRDIPVVMVDSAAGAKLQAALLTETVNASITPDTTTVLGQANFGRGATDTTFAVKVTQPGLYPIRTVWFEGGGGASVEIFSVDLATGAKVLLNDASNPLALKAFRTVGGVGPQPAELDISRNGNQITITYTNGGRLQSATSVTGPWTDVGDNDGSYSTTADGAARFFRVVNP